MFWILLQQAQCPSGFLAYGNNWEWYIDTGIKQSLGKGPATKSDEFLEKLQIGTDWLTILDGNIVLEN